MNNTEMNNDIKENLSLTLEHLSKMSINQPNKPSKTIVDTLQRFVDLYIRNLSDGSYSVNSGEYLDEIETKFIKYVSEELKKEISLCSKVIKHQQTNADHKILRDVVVSYEKLISILKKLEREIEISEKTKTRNEAYQQVNNKPKLLMAPSPENGYLINDDVIGAMIPAIKNRLQYALREGTMLKTNQTIRGIGKTTALIEFAILNKLSVVIRYGAKELRNKYNYSEIFDANEIQGGGKIREVIVDEWVDVSKLRNITVLTGYEYTK